MSCWKLEELSEESLRASPLLAFFLRSSLLRVVRGEEKLHWQIQSDFYSSLVLCFSAKPRPECCNLLLKKPFFFLSLDTFVK